MAPEDQRPLVGVEVAFRDKFGGVLTGLVSSQSGLAVWIKGCNWPIPTMRVGEPVIMETVLTASYEGRPQIDFGWIRLPAAQPERDTVLDAFRVAVALTC